MKHILKLAVIFLLLNSGSSLAQFIIPLTFSGGSGSGNTNLCGTDSLTVTADTIPAGMTYKWYISDYFLACSNTVYQLPLLDSGPASITVSQTCLIECYAVDASNVEQGYAYPFRVYDVEENGGICGDNVVNGVAEVCSGDSIELQVFNGTWFAAINTYGPGTIQWQKNGIDIPGANYMFYQVNSPGTYRVRFTLGCGTGLSNDIQVNYHPTLNPTISGDTTICQGASTILYTNPGFSSYLWATGETTQTITVNTAGTYTVTVSNAAGCTASDFVVVSIYPNPVPVIIGDNSICQGQTTVFDAGSGYLSYIWSNGNTTQTIVVGVPGPYTVTVTDNNGCVGTFTRVLTVNPNPIPAVTGDSTLCLPQTSILNAGGGFPVFTSYFWSNGVFTQANTVSTIGTYTVTVTDINGCTGSDSILVTGPYATISGDNSICSGNSSNLSIAFAGNAPFTYSYNNGVTTIGPFTTVANPATITVSPGANTTYTLLNYSDANCNGNVFGSATVTVSNPAPVITTSDSTLCQTQITVLDAGSGWTGYYWNTNNITQTINVSALGVYTVTVTDSSGCTGIDNIFIGSQPPYTTSLSASGPLGICRGDSVQLIAQTPMVFYTWYRNNILIPGATSSTFWATGTGKYKCQSLDTAGCAATSNQAKVAIVCFPPPPPIDRLGVGSAEDFDALILPNPNAGEFSIRFNREIKETITLKVLDVSGKIIRVVNLKSMQQQLNLDLNKPGYYFLEIDFTGGQIMLKPFVVY